MGEILWWFYFVLQIRFLNNFSMPRVMVLYFGLWIIWRFVKPGVDRTLICYGLSHLISTCFVKLPIFFIFCIFCRISRTFFAVVQELVTAELISFCCLGFGSLSWGETKYSGVLDGHATTMFLVRRIGFSNLEGTSREDFHRPWGNHQCCFSITVLELFRP